MIPYQNHDNADLSLRLFVPVSIRIFSPKIIEARAKKKDSSIDSKIFRSNMITQVSAWSPWCCLLCTTTNVEFGEEMRGLDTFWESDARTDPKQYILKFKTKFFIISNIMLYASKYNLKQFS